MYVVTVQFEIHAEHVDAFRKAMRLQAANSLSKETACRQFDVCFAPENLASCFLYERYENRAAFDVHLASEHFQQFDAQVAPWIKTKTVQVWSQENL